MFLTWNSGIKSGSSPVVVSTVQLYALSSFLSVRYICTYIHLNVSLFASLVSGISRDAVDVADQDVCSIPRSDEASTESPSSHVRNLTGSAVYKRSFDFKKNSTDAPIALDEYSKASSKSSGLLGSTDRFGDSNPSVSSQLPFVWRPGSIAKSEHKCEYLIAFRVEARIAPKI